MILHETYQAYRYHDRYNLYLSLRLRAHGTYYWPLVTAVQTVFTLRLVVGLKYGWGAARRSDTRWRSDHG